jgi:hypothetical protein
MANHHVTTSSDAHLEPVLAAYLSDLSARLPGPGRRGAAILAELRDGLQHATEEHIAAGLSPERAAVAAIAQFGTAPVVADAFAGELATAYARRTIACFIATGPLVGIWWLLLLRPSPGRTGLLALVAAIPVIPLIVLAIATAGATLATTGRLMRWLPETGPQRALAAITAIAGLCMIADLTMITTCVLSGVQARPLSAIAVAASLTRIAGSVTTMRHVTQRANHDQRVRQRRPRARLAGGPGRQTNTGTGA